MQALLELPLVKLSGIMFGPPNSVDLVYFIDDLNLPEVDKYNTQSAIALVRQHMDYEHWFDMTKLSMKRIVKCQYVLLLYCCCSYYCSARPPTHAAPLLPLIHSPRLSGTFRA